jgi:hypothetical protein
MPGRASRANFPHRVTREMTQGCSYTNNHCCRDTRGIAFHLVFYALNFSILDLLLRNNELQVQDFPPTFLFWLKIQSVQSLFDQGADWGQN